MSSTIVPSSLVEQACAVAAQQGWYKVEAAYTLPCGSRASIVGWRPNAVPAHNSHAPQASAAPRTTTSSTSTATAATSTHEDNEVSAQARRNQKKRERKKRKLVLNNSESSANSLKSSAAQLEPATSKPQSLERVAARVEHATVVERAPVRDPARPASPERLEPEPDPAALAKRPRLDRVPPTSQVGERDEVGARIVTMLEELFHDNVDGVGCDCEECQPEEFDHDDDCDCGGCGPAGLWAARRGVHVAQLREARAAGLARWRDAASGMRA